MGCVTIGFWAEDDALHAPSAPNPALIHDINGSSKLQAQCLAGSTFDTVRRLHCADRQIR